jgi:type 1 glutamine amidotransferase
MKNLFRYVCVATLGLCSLLDPLTSPSAQPAKEAPGKIRVMVFTGGHDFEKEPFFKLFKDDPEITYQAVEHPNAHAQLTAEAAKQWDVLVLYDMHQEITEEAKADFVARLKEGKGLVVVHHAIASYQEWPEYRKIIGARYYLKKMVVDGVDKARSAYKHGMHFTLRIADPSHPVTRGLQDFEIVDETYKWFDVYPDVHPLIVTGEPESNPVTAWSKTYENARVVYIQSGHDHTAYENPNYQQMLRQAIRWVAAK